MSSTPKARGTRAYPPTPRSIRERRPLMSLLPERCARRNQNAVAADGSTIGEDDRCAGPVLTSFAVTVIILLFITIVIPTIIGLVRNF